MKKNQIPKVNWEDIKCPYCGNEEEWELEAGQKYTGKCDSCGKKYTVSRDYSTGDWQVIPAELGALESIKTIKV